MDLAAADGHIAAAFEAAADTCAIFSTGSRDLAASDLYLSVIGGASAADACTILSTGSLQTAVLIVVLNGQLAAGVGLVMFQTGVTAAALQLVVAIQLDIGIAFAGHAHGGFVPTAGVDVHILECDLDLIVLLFGLDGDGVLIRRAGDDGVALIFYEVAIALLDFVRPFGVARLHGDVTILDVPCPCKGRGGKGGEHCGSQDKRCCPLRGRTGQIDTPPPV